MKRNALSLFILLLVALSPVVSADWNGMDYGHMSHGGFVGVSMFITMLLFWGLLLFGGVWLFRQFDRRGEASNNRDDAVAIIRRRYAEGELSEQEMTSMLEKLKG